MPLEPLDLSKMPAVPWRLAGDINVNGDWASEFVWEFIPRAAQAFDVMMRRGWGVVQTYEGEWFARDMYNGIEPLTVSLWPDPFTALINADEWYKANVENPNA